ncbi:hypothetical protein ID866_3600 [Astraeus odoratus]|nr:hypothetical protein ID866_3600 [Astraeus odoratus]
MSTTKSSRFAPYQNALRSLSTRTGTPLPSLIFSFAVLHEITAIAPLVGVFFASKRLGLGERFVNQFLQDDTPPDQPPGWFNSRLRQWVDEGEHWAERVGRRYGMFGFVKGQQPLSDSISGGNQPRRVSGVIAGDVANAIFAYATVKALLPVRVGLSLYLSPAFSRRIVDPIRLRAVRIFRRS